MPAQVGAVFVFGGDPWQEGERNAFRKQLFTEPAQTAGAFTYSVPLPVPPGRGAMTPDLSLNYYSKSRNDVTPFGFR